MTLFIKLKSVLIKIYDLALQIKIFPFPSLLHFQTLPIKPPFTTNIPGFGRYGVQIESKVPFIRGLWLVLLLLLLLRLRLLLLLLSGRVRFLSDGRDGPSLAFRILRSGPIRLPRRRRLGHRSRRIAALSTKWWQTRKWRKAKKLSLSKLQSFFSHLVLMTKNYVTLPLNWLMGSKIGRMTAATTYQYNCSLTW